MQKVLQFFESVRKSELIRKVSHQLEKGEPNCIEDKGAIMEQVANHHELTSTSNYDERYRKFIGIIKEIRMVEDEPYIVIAPKVDGRIRCKCK